jgi:hypothetical protein
MDRKDIRENLKKVQSAIAALEKKNKKAPCYETATKHIPAIGYVSEIPTLRECAKALSFVQSKFTNETTAAAELGLAEADIQEEQSYLGFDFETWKSDIQKRVEQLKDESQMEKLQAAEQKLKKHRSADDIFADDMEGMDDLLGSI